MEVDVDIGSSRAAGTIFGVVRGSVTNLVLDLAFVLEGQALAELPEQILCGIRLFHFDLDAIYPTLPIYPS